MSKSEDRIMIEQMLKDIGYESPKKTQKEKPKVNFLEVNYISKFETQKGYY